MAPMGEALSLDWYHVVIKLKVMQLAAKKFLRCIEIKESMFRSVCTLLLVMAATFGTLGYTATIGTAEYAACGLDKGASTPEQP